VRLVSRRGRRGTRRAGGRCQTAVNGSSGQSREQIDRRPVVVKQCFDRIAPIQVPLTTRMNRGSFSDTRFTSTSLFQTCVQSCYKARAVGANGNNRGIPKPLDVTSTAKASASTPELTAFWKALA
jgi:hypothetical protein